MARRYELTDEQFALIEDLLPQNGRRGGQWNGHRTTLNRIFWILHTGAQQWRERPERYGNWSSVHDRFSRWRRDGPFDRIRERRHIKLDEDGRIDDDLWLIDATGIRARRVAAGGGGKKIADEPEDHALGRSRGGFGTKLHLLVDSNGIPLAVKITPGQAHASKHLEAVLESVKLKRRRRGRPRRRPRRRAGDKGYSSPRIRRYLRRRGIKAIIPCRKNERRSHRPFDKETYRRRNVVERCVSWLKENRRLATRYEKLAVNFLTMVKLAMIRRCFRLLDSSDRT